MRRSRKARDKLIDGRDQIGGGPGNRCLCAAPTVSFGAPSSGQRMELMGSMRVYASATRVPQNAIQTLIQIGAWWGGLPC